MALFHITIDKLIVKVDEEKLDFIIQKLNEMGKELDAIKQSLADANDKADKIAADVQRLHDLIAGTGEVPTQAEWDEVKAAAKALNDKLQGIDDSTPE